jgi:hypothetical protein
MSPGGRAPQCKPNNATLARVLASRAETKVWSSASLVEASLSHLRRRTDQRVRMTGPSMYWIAVFVGLKFHGSGKGV